MKKILLRFAFLAGGLLSFIVSNAQEGFCLGIEGTPQLSWLLNKDDMNNTNYQTVGTFNSSWGITSQYGFNKNLGIGLNALYSFQGQRYILSSVESYRKVGYIKVPLMFVYTTEVSPKMLFIGKIGPQFDFLTNASLTTKGGTNIVSDMSSAYQSFNYGAVVHAGFSFKLTDMLMLDIMLRYDYDFTDAEKSGNKLEVINPNPVVTRIPLQAVTARSANTYNTSAGLSIGLKYLFKK